MEMTEERWTLEPLLRALVPLNRTIVSDDMEKAADLLDQSVGFPARRYRYPSGQEYGSWIVPPSWNVKEAYLSDGKNRIASIQDHILFLAPYSIPFEGWITREDLVRNHLIVSDRLDDAFVYQHRLAYDFQKRLQQWQISLPRNLLASMRLERYFVKIDVEVKPGALNVLEYTAVGETDEPAVAFLAHLCHPGQANDGLSGVLAGAALIRRFSARPHRFTYKLLVLPETIGSAVHVVAQNLSPRQFFCAAFLETMGSGERLYLKRSRTGAHPVDLVLNSLARENSELGIHSFHEGYGNDELVFDFPNVGIPSIGVQYYPYPEYHTSRDDADLIDWDRWTRSVDLTEELFRRLEQDRPIELTYPGPPYLSRYRLYADAVTEKTRFRQNAKLLSLCDGCHTLLQICEETGIPFPEAARFFQALDREGLLRSP
jgi:aminopeptidase-like protein